MTSVSGGTPQDPMIGLVLKETYRIEEIVGRGGMATVYKGSQISFGREVAIKMMAPNLQSNESLVKRFYREAKVLGELNHPNILQLFDCGAADDGTLYLVTEFLHGRTLSKIIPKNYGLDWKTLLHVFESLGAALQAAHTKDLIHRDIKPANIFVLDDDARRPHIKLLDFGIAKPLGAEQELTRAGMFVGTPGYMAPEQLRGAPVDARADIYALGVLLYFASTGTKAYPGKDSRSVVAAQLEGPPAPVDMRALGKPQALNDIIAKALSHDAADRFDDVSSFLKALRLAGTEVGDLPQPFGSEESDITNTVAPRAQVTLRSDRPKSDNRALLWGLILLAVGIIVGALGWWYTKPQVTHALSTPSMVDRGIGIDDGRGISSSKVLFGSTATLTGLRSDVARAYLDGIQARLEQANEAGGVHGRQLEFYVADDEGTLEGAVKNVYELLDGRRIFAFLGVTGTEKAEEVALLKDQTLIIAPHTGSNRLRNEPPNRLVFHIRPGLDRELRQIFKILEAQGITASNTVALIEKGPQGQSHLESMAKGLVSLGLPDSEFPKVIRYDNDEDLGLVSEELVSKRRKPKALLVLAGVNGVTSVVDNMVKFGLDVPVATSSLVGPTILERRLKGIIADSPPKVFVTQVMPSLRDKSPLVEAYRQRTDKGSRSMTGLEGYVAAELLVRGLEVAGRDLSTPALVEALETVSFEVNDAIRLHFSEQRHVGHDQVWVHAFTPQGFRPF